MSKERICPLCGRNVLYMGWSHEKNGKMQKDWTCNYCQILGHDTFFLIFEKSEIKERLAPIIFSWEDAINELHKRGIPRDVANTLMVESDGPRSRIKIEDGSYVIDYRDIMESIWDDVKEDYEEEGG